MTVQELKCYDPLQLNVEFIFFRSVGTHRKTGVWDVQNKRNGALLGRIQWHGAWRQYCFFPEGGTVFSKGCLRDVDDFIEARMLDRRTDAQRV